MPDVMDSVQERLLFEQQVREQQQAATAPAVGLDECVRCDEPISAVRKALGARLCLECQTDHEQRERARGGR